MGITYEDIHRTAEKDLIIARRELQNVQKFMGTVQQAIGQFIARKYAPLTKALEENGGDFEQIRNAYGFGFISKRTFDKLSTLQNEKENDATSQLTDEFMRMLRSREAELTHRIENIQCVIAEVQEQEDEE